MKRRNILKEDKEAVSPVIATILMVAITVVLAATLWMMLDTDEDVGRDLYGTTSIGDRSTSGGWVRVDIGSLNPSSVNIEDVTVRLYDVNDELVVTLRGEEDVETENDGNYNLRWTRLEDEELTSRARLFVEYGEDEDNHDFSGYEVEIVASGYSGSLTREL